MTATPLVIVGAGGFGREVLDVVEAVNGLGSEYSSSGSFEFLGYLDDGQPDAELLLRRRAVHLGSVDAAAALPRNTEYVVGIGAPKLRKAVADKLTRLGLAAATIVHPTAAVGGDVEIGSGSIVCSHVSVTTNVRIGRHVHLNLNCTVGHDARVGDFATINPGANVSGSVHLSSAVSIGTNAALIQGISVGVGAVVGAGAAVVRDVPDAVTVVGVPARILQ